MKPTVLIIDDCLTVRMDLRQAFEAGGFAVSAAASAEEARALLADATPAVIVLDRRLPDADGLALLAELKAAGPTAGVPVILLSADAEACDRLDGLGLGAEDYLGKPYDRAYLVERARSLVRTADLEEPVPPLVLVIDDSATFRAALAARLGAAGYQVVEAASGEEGLRLAALRPPDALITDGQMPGLGGDAVIRRLRLDPRLRRIPCLFLTASEDEGDIRQALEAGADASLRKDTPPDLLIARLASLIRTGARQAPMEPNAATPGTRRVLVLSDAADGSLAQIGWTRDEGYDLVHAGSVAEANAFLTLQPATCVVIALADGQARLEACRRLRARPDDHDLPLVLVVPDDEPAALLAAFEAGAEDCVVRGKEPEVARERLRALLRRKQLQDEERRHAALEVAMLRAEAATRAKSEFLAHMSHEIRSPLTAIVGIADLLANTPLTPEQADYVGRFRRAGDTLLTLVNDLLDLAKLEAGQLMLEHLPFDLCEQLERAVELAAVAARAKDLEVRCLVPPGVPRHVLGDAGRLQQILGNLLANAVKFTPRGEVGIRVSPTPAAAPGTLRLEVFDTGIGIPKEKQAQIFESFAQADASTTRRFGGTGLGLPIARELVARMGGSLEVDSEEGLGSTFIITLDLPAAQAPTPAASQPFGKPPRDERPLRVLLAEDAEDNRLVFEAFFATTAYQLTIVEDGHAALERFKAERFDLVLMDVQMPVLDGYQATRAIRRWEAEQAATPTPIVALTAFALKDEVAKTREAGCNAHLSKPISRAALLAAVQEYARPPEAGV